MRSLPRVIGGILVGLLIIVALWTLAWYHPRLACAVMLTALGTGWSWHLNRILKTGRILVGLRPYLRAQSRVAFWFWVGFYFLVGCYLFGGGFYALLTLK